MGGSRRCIKVFKRSEVLRDSNCHSTPTTMEIPAGITLKTLKGSWTLVRTIQPTADRHNANATQDKSISDDMDSILKLVRLSLPFSPFVMQAPS